MKFCITVNGKPMKSNGVVYEFKTPMEAIRYVDVCYGLSSLKEDVEIGMLAGESIEIEFDHE